MSTLSPPCSLQPKHPERRAIRWAGLAGVLLVYALFPSDARAQMLQLDKSARRADPENTAPTDQPPHALALRARWVTVPGWNLDLETDAHTQLPAGWSLGIEYINLRKTYDIVLSVDYSWVNPDNGNYVGKGNNPNFETNFLAFDRLSVVSTDVSIIGHWNLTSWLEIRFGAGLGLGVVIGDIYRIISSGSGNPNDPNDPNNCTLQNAGDLGTCFPHTKPPRPFYDPKTPYPDQNSPTVYCNPDLSESTLDIAQNPCLRRVETYPMVGRVVPVLNTLLGFRIRAHRNVYLHIEGGWRLVGFYAGAGPEFRF